TVAMALPAQSVPALTEAMLPPRSHQVCEEGAYLNSSPLVRRTNDSPVAARLTLFTLLVIPRLELARGVQGLNRGIFDGNGPGALLLHSDHSQAVPSVLRMSTMVDLTSCTVTSTRLMSNDSTRLALALTEATLSPTSVHCWCAVSNFLR